MMQTAVAMLWPTLMALGIGGVLVGGSAWLSARKDSTHHVESGGGRSGAVDRNREHSGREGGRR